jgi:F-type H+-transporting ATPase subunit b
VHELVLAAAVPAKDPPVIDLDSTVFLQLGIFLVTAFILSQLLFKPYLRVKAAREAGIEGAKDEARRMEEEAKAKVAQYETAYGRAKVTAQAERVKLHGEAMERERQITGAAFKSSQGAVEDARKNLETEAAKARAALEPRAQEIARAIAKKVLGREVA